MNKIQEIISCIRNGEVRKISGLFSSAIAVKACDKLTNVKKEIAKEMFTPKKKVASKLNEDVLSDIQNVVSTNVLGQIKLANGETLDVDVPTANVLLTVLNALNDENKQRMLDKLNSNAQEFLKVVDFAWKQVE